MIWVSNPDRGRILNTCPSGPSNLQYSVYRASFLVVKQPGHGIEQPLLSSAEVKERVELALLVFHNCASIACSKLNITVHACFISYMPDALMLPQTIVESACHLFIFFHLQPLSIPSFRFQHSWGNCLSTTWQTFYHNGTNFVRYFLSFVVVM